MSETPSSQRELRLDLAAVCVVAFVFAVVVIYWMGDLTVYVPPDRDWHRPSFSDQRAELHEVILHNRVPEGKTWAQLRAEGLNVRLLAVWTAEGIHRATGCDVPSAYRIIDLVGCWLGLVLLYGMLLRWFSPSLAFGGMCLFAALLPLTLLFHYFHPWDRLGFLLWVAATMLALRGRVLWLALVMLVAIVNKNDALAVPALYWFLTVRRERFWRVTLVALGILLLGLAEFLCLLHFFPVGAGGQRIDAQAWSQLGLFWRNLDKAEEMGILYPPLLTQGLLLLLGLVGWNHACPERRRLWSFGLALLLPYFLVALFEEVRATTANTMLMLPLALTGLETALGDRKQELIVNSS